MKVLIKQSCQFGEGKDLVFLKGSKQKPGTQTVPASIVFDPYFSMLVKEGKLTVLSFTDKDSEEVEALKLDASKLCPAVAAQIAAANHEADEVASEPAADLHLKIELEEANASIETLQAKVEAHEVKEQQLGEQLLQLTSDKEALEAKILQLQKENEEHIAEKADLAAQLVKAKKK